MNGPRIVCAGCGCPTRLDMPLCEACGGKRPIPFCALCEASTVRNARVLPADSRGLHSTKDGGYAGSCAKSERAA